MNLAPFVVILVPADKIAYTLEQCGFGIGSADYLSLLKIARDVLSTCLGFPTHYSGTSRQTPKPPRSFKGQSMCLH